MRGFLRWLTYGLWAHELNDHINSEISARRELTLIQMNMDTLVDLFREKQAKISRLQGNYMAKTAPLREDLRGERPMGNLQDHLNLLAMAPERQDRMIRGRFPGKPSDGTVEGVPFDEPNRPVAEIFDSPRPSMLSPAAIAARRGNFSAAGADPFAKG